MTQPQSDLHTIQPPPSDDKLNRQIAEILVASATVYIAAKLIEKLLRPYGIGIEAVLASVKIASKGTSHKQRAKYRAHGINPKSPAANIIRQTANEDLYYRAAYVVQSSHRLQRKMNERKAVQPSPIELASESMNYRKHEAARGVRLQVAMKVVRASQLFGDILGWYLNPALNNERECIAANGNNFRIDAIPLIGLPGAVHVGCGCSAGEPHDMPPARWVDQAVESAIQFGARPALLKLKRKAS